MKEKEQEQGMNFVVVHVTHTHTHTSKRDEGDDTNPRTPLHSIQYHTIPYRFRRFRR